MGKKISEIKTEFERADRQSLPFLYEKYKEDDRAGVVSLIAKYRKQEERLLDEIRRTELLRIRPFRICLRN